MSSSKNKKILMFISALLPLFKGGISLRQVAISVGLNHPSPTLPSRGGSKDLMCFSAAKPPKNTSNKQYSIEEVFLCV